jgi:hypothetical protein
MSTTQPKSAIQTAIEKTHRPVIDAIQKDHDAQLPDLRALIDRLTKAMDASDAKALQTYRQPFDEHVKFATGLVARASKAGDGLKSLAPKAPDDQKLVKDLSAKLAKLSKVLDQNLLNLKAGQSKLQDAFDKSSGVAERFAEEYARLGDLLDRHVENCQWRVKQHRGFMDKAKAAVADRDRKLLPELVKMALKFFPGTPGHGEVQKAWESYSAKDKVGGLDAKAKEQFARELPKLKQAFDSTTAMEQEISKLHMALGQLEIMKVDAAKAAAHMKVPASELQTFKDIMGLKISSMEKFLDDVGKSLKPPRTGKQIIDELKKAKIL